MYTQINSGYRPLQRDVIESALAGHDVFVQAATGFGKSLCFQLPAIIDHGSKLLRTYHLISSIDFF
jgi:superfamily II DNA helicase RecQ